MHFVIMGAGVVGFEIARHLIDEGIDVVIIEKDHHRAKYVSNHLDCMVIQDEGKNIKVLKKAGIEKANFFISVTSSDEINMIACGIVSSEFDVPIKIARVRNIEYVQSNILQNTFLGIDFLVNSEIETARKIANTVALGANSDVMLFEETDFQMRNLLVDDKSYFKNKTIKSIRRNIKEEFIIPAIFRDDMLMVPSGKTVIKENDNIYILATKNTMTRIFIEAGKKSEKIDKIIIVGGGKIGTLACQYLIRTGRKITIIESDYEKCKILSQEFSDALIINADISDEDIFIEEKLSDYDLIITATDNQELNIITSVYSKSVGIKRAVALITKSSYMPMASKLNIDSVINPKHTTVDAILKFVRRGEIRSVHSIFNYKAEVIEYQIDEASPVIGKKISELSMPENSLILTIIRNKQDFIPDGNTVVLQGDLVIIIVKKESIKAIEHIFAG